MKRRNVGWPCRALREAIDKLGVDALGRPGQCDAEVTAAGRRALVAVVE